MVIKNETKEDVFAGFHHLDQTVPDNEEKLNRKVEKASLIHGNVNRNRRRATNMLDKGVFADFKLNELVEHQEKLEAKQKQAPPATEQVRPTSVRGKLASLVTAASTGHRDLSKKQHQQQDRHHHHGNMNNESDSDSDSSIYAAQSNKQRHHHHRPRPRPRHHHHHRHHKGNGLHHNNFPSDDDHEGMKAGRHKEAVDIRGIDIVNNNNGKMRIMRNLFKNSNRSSVLTTPTVTLGTHEMEEDGGYHIGGRSDHHRRRRVVLSGDVLESGDDDSHSNNSTDDESDVKSIYSDSGGEGDDGGDRDDDSYIGNDHAQRKTKKHDTVITRSSTGMSIGGMEVRFTGKTKNKHDNQSHTPEGEEKYRWVSPHLADMVFSDFDLDAIVAEYEKSQRKINFGTNDQDIEHNGKNGKYNADDDDDDDDNDDEHKNRHISKITVRYRTICKIWIENFPRAHGIIFKVVLPLLIMVVLTMVLGNFLAKLEKPWEVSKNDEIMRNKNELEQFHYNETLHQMFVLPALCFQQYMAEKVKGNLATNLIDFVAYDFPSLGQENYFDNDRDNFTETTLGEIESLMKTCEDDANKLAANLIEYTEQQIAMKAGSGMTFNWIRCWDQNKLEGVNPWFPNRDHLVAAREQNQFFEDSWHKDQEELYKQYLKDANCSDTMCIEDMYNQSVTNATGSKMCDINKGASAWFWFVVMTTVGYGNQSPETTNGRILVGLVGWICIIMWAIILYVGGKVLGIVIDDAFRRCGCRAMTGDGMSAFVWGAVAGLWIVLVGEIYRVWLDYTANPLNFKYNVFEVQVQDIIESESEQSIAETGDAYWFAYISLLTVGLGDFYLDSESFFYKDLFLWSFYFLIGFTFLSTFLGQLADLIFNLFPDGGVTLKEQLTNTKVVRMKDIEFKKRNEEGIEKLEKLVEVMDDDDKRLIRQRVTRIRVKQNLLVHLLYQTKMEMEYYKKRGERYENLSYGKVCQEENMLNEVLFGIVKERETLETYRRTEVSSTPPPGSARKKSYFQDGTGAEDLEQKLSLRKGKKSVKTRMKASTYL